MKHFNLLLLLISICSCSQQKNDLDNLELKGKVKSVEMSDSYIEPQLDRDFNYIGKSSKIDELFLYDKIIADGKLTFNENGNLLTNFISKNSFDGVYDTIYNSKTYYSYDKDGAYEQSKIYNSENELIWNYSINKKNNTIEISNGSYIISLITLNYNNEKLSSKEFYNINGLKKELLIKREYFYESGSKNLNKEITHYYVKNKTDKSVREFDKEGRIKKYFTNYDFLKSSKVIDLDSKIEKSDSLVATYKYSSNKKNDFQVEVIIQGEKEFLMNVKSDENDNIILIEELYFENKETRKSTINIDYVYDENKNWTKKTSNQNVFYNNFTDLTYRKIEYY
jgi:hypothetical protein